MFPLTYDELARNYFRYASGTRAGSSNDFHQDDVISRNESDNERRRSRRKNYLGEGEDDAAEEEVTQNRAETYRK